MPTEVELGELVRKVVRVQPLLADPTSNIFAPGSDGPPRRFGFWGDSHIAAGPFMPTLMQVLGAHGVQVAPSYLPPTMGRANVRLAGLRAWCMGSGWSTQLAYTQHADDIDVGPALARRVTAAGPESYVWLDLRDSERRAVVRQVRLAYSMPEGATVEYVIDDGAPQQAILAPSAQSQLLVLAGTHPMSTLKLSVSSGQLAMDGFLLDYQRAPAVIFDVFGIPSSTVAGWAHADPARVAQALHGTSYDGVLLEYGTNEGAASDFDADRYARLLENALRNLRAVFPAGKVGCVLVGPPDRGVLGRGHTRAQLLEHATIEAEIERAQQRVASRFDCVTWNWQDLMGGPGGSYGWALARPPMMAVDLTHLSAAGYRETAHALAHSLGWEQ